MAIPVIAIVLRLAERTEIERWVAVMSLGICAAIADGSMSIETAESRLFNPRTLVPHGINQPTVETLHVTSLEGQRLLNLCRRLLGILSELEHSGRSNSQAQQWMQT
ncbi:MAG: hypothetical protein HC866_16820 [Leptolyngbyaceae cyanobacterium RU_5_1]|nr:hypothetical protein [Leptolyngbyaceae cyanobacterium RU_5_1]